MTAVQRPRKKPVDRREPEDGEGGLGQKEVYTLDITRERPTEDRLQWRHSARERERPLQKFQEKQVSVRKHVIKCFQRALHI